MSNSHIFRPKDICWGKIPLNKNEDNRYGVVLDPPVGNIVKVLAISSQKDLYNSSWHLLIEENDTDFAATNLKKTSYIICESIISVSVFDIKYCGRLEGNLAIALDSYI